MALLKNEFIDKVRQAGIVGAGGAGFPTYFKLKNQAEYFIVNISECEPLLKVDQQISFHFADQIIQVLDLIQEILEIKEVHIAIKKKYQKACEEFIKSIKKNKSDVKLCLLDDFYPAGDEYDIVYNVTERTVPMGGLPIDVGVIVDNVGTVYNIYNTIYNDQPVTHRWLTVTGEVNKPQTLNCPIGTPLTDVIDLCGGSKIDDYILMDGGPMMGNLISEPDKETVTKTMTGLILFPKDHDLIIKKQETIEESIKHSRLICEQCVLCTEFCSRYILGHHDLNPHLMMRRISYQNRTNLENYTDAFLCSECGLCTYYACPMSLSPKDIYKFLKLALRKNKIDNPYMSFKREVKSTLPEYTYRRVPLKKLKIKLNVYQYDYKAPLKLSSIPGINSVRINLSQHIGEKTIPVVTTNQKVRQGDMIADVSSDSLGVPVHASITGTVKKITDDYIEISTV